MIFYLCYKEIFVFVLKSQGREVSLILELNQILVLDKKNTCVLDDYSEISYFRQRLDGPAVLQSSRDRAFRVRALCIG